MCCPLCDRTPTLSNQMWSESTIKSWPTFSSLSYVVSISKSLGTFAYHEHSLLGCLIVVSSAPGSQRQQLNNLNSRFVLCQSVAHLSQTEKISLLILVYQRQGVSTEVWNLRYQMLDLFVTYLLLL